MRAAIPAAGALLAALVLFLPAARAAGDPARGKEIYETRCFACHSLDANRVGPKHRGVYGRTAGMVAGYAYSPALKASGIVWSEATLDRWLAGPRQLVPGTKMSFSLPDAGDRADVIAYLRQESGR
jgi:cytochrome c